MCVSIEVTGITELPEPCADRGKVIPGNITAIRVDYTSAVQNINQTHKYAPMDPMDIIKLHYHYLGHDRYLIKGHDQNQGITSKRNRIFHFNLKRHHRAYFSGIRHGKFGDQGIYVKY